MTSGRVLVVGSANVDHVAEVDRLPEPGATVAARSYRIGPGGKGLNQAVAAARQGAEVTMVAALGTEAAGNGLAEVLAAEDIDARWVARRSDVPTGVALISVAEDGTNSIVVAAGANGTLVEVPEDSVKGASVVLVQLEVPVGVVRDALAAGRRHGAITICNPAPAPPQGLPGDFLRLVDVLTPNETEAAVLTGRSSPEEAAAALLECGVGAVVVTLGPRGALFADREGMQVVAPFPVDAVDTTAAGDAFCGALAAALARGDSMGDALPQASAAGALAATIPGAVLSLPTTSEVQALLSERPAGGMR